ncbi:MAG: ABC transporter permease [Bacteroidia bacterium]|nr:ABC transporter permease [Bacteroidia bacterium]
MRKLLAAILKELLLIIRDIPALLILFIMPVFLFILLSVIEEKVMNNDESKFSILYFSRDTSDINREFLLKLSESEYFNIISVPADDSQQVIAAMESIAAGKYQVGLYIPQNATRRAFENTLALMNDSLSHSTLETTDTSRITLYFDPAIKESYKKLIISAINNLNLIIKFKIIVRNFNNILKEDINRQFSDKIDRIQKKSSDIDIPESPFKKQIIMQITEKMKKIIQEEDTTVIIPELSWADESFFKISEEYAKTGNRTFIKPSVSQSRVPAFTLFAMFFIVIPLAGSIINERNEGTFDRLKTFPVSYITILAGKIVVYLFVCLLQFIIILLTGLYIFPSFFGLPELVITSDALLILLTAVISAFAAIGFGLLVGSFATSHAQAATFGSVMVVIFGILGGVFIPIYIMPDSLKLLSSFSPLRWGIDSFIDLFVRNTEFLSILTNIIKLFIFFSISLAVTLITYIRKN